MDERQGLGVPPAGSGHSRVEPQASPAEPSVPNADKVLLTGMGPTERGWEMGFRDGPESGGILHVMAAGLADMMLLDSDKPLNCIEVDVQPAGKPLLRLTMTRANGKGPVALKAEAVKLLRQTLEAIESGRSEPLFIMRDAIRNYLEDDPAQAILSRRAETTGSAGTESSAVPKGCAHD